MMDERETFAIMEHFFSWMLKGSRTIGDEELRDLFARMFAKAWVNQMDQDFRKCQVMAQQWKNLNPDEDFSR